MILMNMNFFLFLFIINTFSFQRYYMRRKKEKITIDFDQMNKEFQEGIKKYNDFYKKKKNK